jgi:hypothetical protein
LERRLAAGAPDNEVRQESGGVTRLVWKTEQRTFQLKHNLDKIVKKKYRHLLEFAAEGTAAFLETQISSDPH